MEEKASQARLGIDFGTSNTVAVLARPGREITPLLFDGAPSLPSAVFNQDGRLLAGRDAERAAMSNPAAFEPHPKRCLSHGTVLLAGQEFSAIDLVAAVLSRVASETFRVLGGVPESVVLTHPAVWADHRLRSLVIAARRAGLPEPLLTAEPVAAATHFARYTATPVRAGDHLAVYDLGGGTFDVTVVRAGDGGVEVAATEGLHDVGGIDIDYSIIEHLSGTYPGQDWRRLRDPASPADRRHRRGLWRDVRDAKEILSRESAAALFVPILDIDAHLTREELESLAGPLLERTVSLTMGVLERAEVGLESLAGMFLVGGASRMPLSATMLLRTSGVAPTVLEQPELVVASGALDAPASTVVVDDDPDTLAGFTGLGPFRGVAKVPEPEGPIAGAVDAGNDAAEGAVTALALRDARHVAAVRGRSVVIAEIETGKYTAVMSDHVSAPSVVSWSPDGALLAAACGTEVKVWPVTPSGVPVVEEARIVSCPRRVSIMAWASEGLACGDAGEVHVWDVAAARVVATGQFSAGDNTGQLRALAWAPHGGMLATGGSHGDIKVWKRGEDTPFDLFSVAPVAVRSLEWSPDAEWLISGDAGGGLCVWQLTNAAPVQSMTRAHDAAVQSVVMSPDGKLLVSAGIDGAVRVWDAGSGRPQHVLKGHTGAVHDVGWSPEGDRVVSAGADGVLRVWDVETGFQVGPSSSS